MDSSRHLEDFVASLSKGEIVLSYLNLAGIERKAIAHMNEVVDYFFNTQPADRATAERAILTFHHHANVHGNQNEWLDQKPQFIWCQSPQAMVVISKVLSDIHEGTRPVKPSGMRPGPGAKIHAPARLQNSVRGDTPVEYLIGQATDVFDSRGLDISLRAMGTVSGHWSSTVENETLDSLFRGTRRGGSVLRGTWPWSLENIASQIRFSIKTNPDTTLYSEQGGNGKDGELVERSLAATEPHLSQIKLDPKFYGRRLKLRHAWLGQHAVDDHSYTDLAWALRRSCNWVMDYGSFVFCCERPAEIHYQDLGTGTTRYRLHNENGPAVRFHDGWQMHVLSGVGVPDFVVEKPHLITTFKINREQNQEVRRIMIDRFKFGEQPSGIAAYVIACGAKRISHDERWGTLWRFRNAQLARSMGEIEDETYVMLEVVNRSPEPDGSFKRYYLRVPPNMRTAHQAAAWTFGFTGAELDLYYPLQES
jgi:hypothetical protein